MMQHALSEQATRGRPMEGLTAAWYARLTRNDLPRVQREAARIAAALPPGAHVLEIAPGPGYLAIELAKRGAFAIETVDVSHSFVRIARRNAADAGVKVAVHQGDVHALPFETAAFDDILCCAAFKNFADPVAALREMRRVVRPNGHVLIIDLRRDVTDEQIDDFVADYGASWLNRLVMRRTFKNMLRPRAYVAEEFRRMAAEAEFGHCDIKADVVALDIRLAP